jgi:hypothetical protein
MKTGDLVRINHANLPRCIAVVIRTDNHRGYPAVEIYSLETGKVRVYADKVEVINGGR